MKLSAFCIRRPVSTVMVTLIAVILGVISLMNLKQDLMPEMNLGIAIVMASYDGAGPQEIESIVTKPLEDALGTVTNLKNLYSTSSSGSSLIILEFNDGTDMDNAALKMRENIDMITGYLPDGVEPRVLQIDPNMMQSFTLGVTGNYDLVKLKTILDDEIVGRIEKLNGVGSVSDSGGKERVISVDLYPDKLSGYGVSAAQISGLLAAENINMPGGTLNQGNLQLQIRTTGEFKSVSEIENLPLTTPRGATIRLSDVARVTDGFKKTTSYSIINGREGITVSIQKQSTANTVDVANRINAELELLRRDYPDLELTVIMDTASYIKTSLSNVWSTAFQATLLAVLVLLIFLGSVRSSVIIGVAIPVSVIVTMAFAYFSKLTLNMITLNALVISVGMLVDNSVVVLESITRHLDEGKDPKEAARIGAEEVGVSVMASTLTTVVVFVPVIFVSGIAGEMFGQLGLIIAFSLISSLVVSLTFVPMACSKFLKNGDYKRKTVFNKPWESWNSLYKRLEAAYGRLLKWAITHKKTVIAVFILFVLATGSVIGFMGMEFSSEMDQGYLSVDISTPIGSRLEEVSAATDTALERLDGISEIKNISVSIGGGGMFSFGGSGSNSSSIIIELIPKAQRRTMNEVAEDIRLAVGEIAGAEISVANSGNMGSFGGGSVSLTLYGDDLEALSEAGDDIVELMAALPTIRNAETSLQQGGPQARVVIDRSKASLYGLQASAVASTVNMAVSGRTVTRYKVSGSEIDVVMRYQPERLEYINDLKNLTLMTPAGASIPLSEVAEVYEELGPAAITKENHRRYITISADFVDTDLNTITAEVGALIDRHSLPSGITYKFGGTFETMMESFNALGLALILGFVLVYMVIASQFESLAYPATILFSIPVAWTCGIFGVFLTGNSLSIVSMIGLILLMGIVVNNGIILVDYINLKRREGLTTIEAILFAGPVRLRPILMTTITTVVGLLPMLFSNGDGSEMQKPLGAVIAFGLTLSTFVTLILIPVLYLILHNIRKKLKTDKIKM